MTSEPAEASRLPWLDRWLEPPWRAVLTWMALAAAMSLVDMCGGAALVARLNTLAIGQMRRVFAGALSPYVENLAFISNIMLLLLWYQPFVLRLSLLRWAIWMSIVVVWADVVAVRIGYWQAIGINDLPLQIWLWPMLAGLLLVGCRSRPWMSLPAGALSMGTGIWLQVVVPTPFYRTWWPDFPAWWWLPVSSFPYAILMLYGTRRLPRA